jgi:hypothetical protein
MQISMTGSPPAAQRNSRQWHPSGSFRVRIVRDAGATDSHDPMLPNAGSKTLTWSASASRKSRSISEALGVPVNGVVYRAISRFPRYSGYRMTTSFSRPK